MSVVIPFTRRPLSKRPLSHEAGHERRERPPQSGILICELTTLTPLCIMSAFKNAREADQPVIPASSLRGMVRGSTEVLGAACLRLMDRPPRNAPALLAVCSPANACLACRVFGFTDGNTAWAGKVLFTDARPKNLNEKLWTRIDASRQASGQPAPADHGWVLFPKETVEAARRAGNTRAITSEKTLLFRVDYLNLDAEELAVFLFALTLTHDRHRLCHTLGYAKALGFGACTIRIANNTPPQIDPVALQPYLDDPVFATFSQARSIAP